VTNGQIHSGLVRWLSATLALPVGHVIKADQSGKRPAEPYVMVRMTGTEEVRQHPREILYGADQGNAGVIAAPLLEIEWRFSLHAYGAEPSDVLRPISSARHLAQRNEPMMPGVVIFETSQIRIVPDYVNEQWEPRAQMDMMLRGLTSDGFLINTVEQYSFKFTRR